MNNNILTKPSLRCISEAAKLSILLEHLSKAARDAPYDSRSRTLLRNHLSNGQYGECLQLNVDAAILEPWQE